MARTQQDKTLFKDSLARCVSNGAFLDRFYALFLGSSEQVRDKFKNTHLPNQKIILKASLYIMETAADSATPPAALTELAKKHDRTHYDIKPELYDIWLDCMVRAAKDSDPQFTAETESAWRNTMRPGVEVMKSLY